MENIALDIDSNINFDKIKINNNVNISDHCCIPTGLRSPQPPLMRHLRVHPAVCPGRALLGLSHPFGGSTTFDVYGH